VQERRPFPNLSFILADEGAGKSWYNSLQATFKKEMSNGLSFLSSYTYAEALNTVGEWGTFSYRWTHLDRGWNPDVPRQRWVTSGIYNLPFGQNAHGVARQATAGWGVNGIFTLQSGYPFAVGTTTDQSNTGAFISLLYPNRTCNGSLSGSARSRLMWFDTNCFALPAQNSFGDAGINYLFGPGTTSLDFAVLKNFPITEEPQFQLRIESFNVLNNVNFQNPGSTLATPSFGIISSANPARIIQFGLKFLF
jgi:hypothetical protein